MSSPFTGLQQGYPDRTTVSSPGVGHQGREDSQGSEDISVRPMRLKVLYTFDDQNKTNCLARWPQVLDIRTAYLDETTQIGVIELKTCIQAIVSASPELVAKLGQDYTVYAYDYSEYETPLVGQGMLSWVLASSSTTPSAPAHMSRTVVTGRVCKNILGLFSSSSQETLEVKLRLVPVPTCLQSEYMESMKKYRDLSKIMPEGFDSGAWTSFLQANPSILQLASQSRFQLPAIGTAQREGNGLELVQRLENQSSMQRHSVEQPCFQQNHNGLPSGQSEQPPRPASPASSVQSATAPLKRRGRPPRNPSRTSNRGNDIQPKTLASREPGEPISTTNDERSEEGPVKKRAKVSKADWPGTTNLGKQPESLRVAASTAASVRMYQPTALRPSLDASTALEGPTRAPTPIANPVQNARRPPTITNSSSLGRESYSIESVPYQTPYGALDAPSKPPESAMTSPEGSGRGSLLNTPPELASSPPIYRGASTVPSSPNLPKLPQHVDSGFMSGSIDDLFEDDEFRPLDDEDLNVATQYHRRSDLPLPLPDHSDSPQTVPPETILQQKALSDQMAIVRSRSAARNATGSRVLDRTVSSADILTSSHSNDDPLRPSGLCRSRTWSGNQDLRSNLDTAPLPPVSKPSEASSLRSRSGSGANAKRKKAIQSKLETSIAAGEMPPFCENCGAIETPTWRKAWVKVHSGTPEHVRISEEEGGIIAWETLQTDAAGNVSLYRIIKRTLLTTDEGFTEILLCNPCGLWLHTRKCIRPKEVWEKPQKGPDEKRKRAPRARKQKTDSTSEQSRSDSAQGGSLQSDSSSPANDNGADAEKRQASQVSRYSRPRASSLQLSSFINNSNNTKDTSAVVALQRAIQSSPARLTATNHVLSETGDLTPKPTRRVLFPSPKYRDPKLLAEGNSKLSRKSDGVSPKAFSHPTTRDYNQANKENCPPDEEESLDCLFRENQQSISCPSTPIPAAKTPPQLFKTPIRLATAEDPLPTTGDFFSSAARAFLLQPTTPIRTPSKTALLEPLGDMTPFTAHMNQLLSEVNNTSPSRGGNFDFPSLPSLDNSPSGRTRQGFSFAEFDPQDLLSTDMPMPSSPPAWFGVYEDPIEPGGGLWSDYQFPTSPKKAESTSPKKAMLLDAEDGTNDKGREDITVSAMKGDR